MTQIFSKSCNSEAREDISQACEIKILRKVSQIDLKTDFPCQFSVEFFSVNIDFRSTFPDFESTSNQGLIELLTSNQRNFQSRKISCIPLASLRVKHETWSVGRGLQLRLWWRLLKDSVWTKVQNSSASSNTTKPTTCEKIASNLTWNLRRIFEDYFSQVINI